MVSTVLGPLPAAELGVTLTHEHILIDQSYLTGYSLSEHELNTYPIDEQVSLDNLWIFKRNLFLSTANVVMQDVEIATKESTTAPTLRQD